MSSASPAPADPVAPEAGKLASDPFKNRRYAAGFVDAGIRVKSVLARGKKKLKITTHTPRYVGLLESGKRYVFSSLYMTRLSSNEDQKFDDVDFKAVAEYRDDTAMRVLRNVGQNGLVNKKLCQLAYRHLESKISIDEVEQAIKEEADRDVQTTTVERKIRVKKAKAAEQTGADAEPEAEPDAEPEAERVENDILPTDEEVNKVHDEIDGMWLSGFIDAIAVAKKSKLNEETGKTKIGRLIIPTHTLPGGLAVAGAIQKKVGAGKLLVTKPRKHKNKEGFTKAKARLVFGTLKDLKALKAAVNLQYVDIDALT